MKAFADSRQLWRGALRPLVRSLFLDLTSLFGGKKRPFGAQELWRSQPAKVHAVSA
jgi:hypothetical protein